MHNVSTNPRLCTDAKNTIEKLIMHETSHSTQLAKIFNHCFVMIM